MQHAALPPYLAPYLTVVIIQLVCAPYSDSWVEFLYFDARYSEQWWRLLSAHFTHWSWSHLFANIIGTLLIAFLYGELINGWRLVGAVGFLAVFVSVCLVLFYQRDFYVGFSGILYGVFVFCALMDWQKNKWLNSGILLFIVGRQIYGYFTDPSDNSWLGIAVAYEVHFFGIVGALIWWGVSRVVKI